jgi:signal transduction histidine kinase
MVMLSVQNLIFCILWSCYFYGGVHSPTLPWVLTIPLLAFFYIGPASPLRFPLLALFVVNVAVFGFLYSYPQDSPKALPAEALQGLGLVSTFATAVYVAMMAIYFSKILASGAELESEMKQHLATAAELRRATSEAERASAAKTEFLARMSHELRTPLHSVIGYSELMLDTMRDEDHVAQDLKKIHSAGLHLLKLIEEILDLSKIEAGKMDLFVESIDLRAIIETVAADCQALIDKNQNALMIECSASIGEIKCDADKLRKALSQLVDNAAKFTASGLIVVSASRERSPDKDELILKISDTGCGISADKIPTLFDTFTAAGDMSASKYGSTGLGLALTQKFCWIMGGEISVSSKPALGTTFTVRLPADQSNLGSLDSSTRRASARPTPAPDFSCAA